MGITRAANVTHLDRIGIPVFMVVRPGARSLSVDQGKGLDPVAAKVSGLMEAVERFHAEHAILPVRRKSCRQLRRSRTVAQLEKLPVRADSPFDEDYPLPWVEGHDLLSGDPAWVPLELVSMDYRQPSPDGFGCFIATRTGAAAGNHPAETLVHAICEIIERDALTLWMLQTGDQQARSRLRLDTVDDPACCTVIAAIRRAGIDVVVWDITSDIGVPAFVCQIIDSSAFLPVGVTDAGGSGCHPTPTIALLRALTEALQSRLTYISGARDDLTRADFRLPGKAALVERRALKSGGRRRSFQDIDVFDGKTFDDDLRWLLNRLVAAGIEQVIAVDLLRPEFGIPVFRVVIPGLEDGYDTEGYVPGVRAMAARAIAQ